MNWWEKDPAVSAAAQTPSTTEAWWTNDAIEAPQAEARGSSSQASEDLMVPRPSNSPEFKAQHQEIKDRNGVLVEQPLDGSRIGDSLRPVFGDHNPIAETYDRFIEPFNPLASSQPKTEAEKAEQEFVASRSFGDRAKGFGNFVGSIPVRAVTQGEYGAGDILTALGMKDEGAKALQSEQDFTRANAPQLEALQEAGDLALGTAGVSLAKPASPRAHVEREFRPELHAPRAAAAAEDAAAFDRQNVRPFGPAFQQGPMASVAKQLSETPVIGGPIKNALDESLRGTADAVQRVRRQIGDADEIRQGGVAAQEGLERFKDARPADVVGDRIGNLSDAALSDVISAPTSTTTLKTKQAALYERAWRNIPEEMRQGRAVEGDARVMSGVPSTRAVLNDIVQRNTRMTNAADARRAGNDAFANPVQGGLLGRMVEALRNPNWRANLQTLRNMRSEFRRLSSGMSDTEKNVLKASDLDRIQSAITSDMIEQLQRNGQRALERGDSASAQGYTRAIRHFQQADRFTRLSMERLESVEKLFNASSVESLAKNIQKSALGNGKGDLMMLRSLHRILRPEEMGEVASAVLSELGKPIASARGVAQEIDFSVNSFVTRWNQMSPAAKNILFAGEHAAALDDLVKIANRLSNVESLANTSRSGTNALNVGGVFAGGSALATGQLPALLGGLASGAATSVILSRPAYVKWAIGYAKIRAKALSGSSAAIAPLHVQIRALAKMAKSDPRLVPVVADLVKENNVTQPDR